MAVLRIDLNYCSSRLWPAVEVFGDLAEGKHFSRRLVSVKLGLMHLASHGHKRFPEGFAFILNNRVRRFLNPPDRLISMLNVSSSDVVVDFGCGPGFYTIPLAKIAGRAIGVDVSSKMLEKLTSNATKYHTKVDLVRSDGTKINLENGSVSLILLVHVFHEIEDKNRVLREFHRILRDSGRLVIVERTRGGMLSRRFGPPIMNEPRIISEIEGFTLARTVPFRDDAIFICKKSGNSNE